MLKRLLLLTTLLLCSTLSAGCQSTGKNYPVQEGVDLVWLDKGQVLTAPTSGAFLSDSFYKEQFDRCGDHR